MGEGRKKGRREGGKMERREVEGGSEGRFMKLFFHLNALSPFYVLHGHFLVLLLLAVILFYDRQPSNITRNTNIS